MRDLRRAPFCWQSCNAMVLIRESWDGRRLTVAIAIYQALTELANEERSDRFAKPTKIIAQRSGTSERTVREYAPGFEGLGLLRRHERVGEGGAVLAPEWELVSTPHPPAAAAGGAETADAETPHPPAAAAGLYQETPIDTKTLRNTSTRVSPSADPPDPEIERLCKLMEETANRSADTPGKARITKTWHVEMERLHRIDGRTMRQIEYVIVWVGQDSFWRSNVLGIPTLRDKFDQLVARIKSENEGRGPRDGGPSANDLKAKAAELRAQGL